MASTMPVFRLATPRAVDAIEALLMTSGLPVAGVSRTEARGLRAPYLLTMTAEHYFPRFGFERVERAHVPKEIAETEEFRDACPASAVAMRCMLRTGHAA